MPVNKHEKQRSTHEFFHWTMHFFLVDVYRPVFLEMATIIRNEHNLNVSLTECIENIGYQTEFARIEFHDIHIG
jgi:hypothetical protein